MSSKSKTSKHQNDSQAALSRRGFLKTAGALGVGSMLSPLAGASMTEAQETTKTVPTRPFGKTGVNVSTLSLGGMFDIPNNQLLLRQALQKGVTYWDTANSYGGGRSEKGIGKYLERYPDDRKKIFLVTKSGAWSMKGMEDDLATSLDRMKTDYIDLYFVHGVRSTRGIDSDMRKWAEKAKSSGKIRFFGFSTHSNMEECLLGAAKLGWIDGIMMTYNFRLMHEDRMKAAVDACHQAGIGLTAMKTQGGGPIGMETDNETALGAKLLKEGYSEYQAKLKAIWENQKIASICSQMPNMSILMANIAAALDRTSLSDAGRRHLMEYAANTASGYCAGCAGNCESTMLENVPIADVMRCLMYSRSYRDGELARMVFREIPKDVRTEMASVDYAPAERVCPRKLPIARLMGEAVQILS